MVELLECREKHTYSTGTFEREPDQLIRIFGLRLAVQTLHEVVTISLAYGLGRTLPAVLPMQTPRIRGEIAKVRDQGVEIGACCSVSNVVLQFVVKGRQWSMRKAIVINHDDGVATGHSLGPSYDAELLGHFHTSHTPLLI